MTVHALAVTVSQDIMVHVVSPVQQASMAVQKLQVCCNKTVVLITIYFLVC